MRFLSLIPYPLSLMPWFLVLPLLNVLKPLLSHSQRWLSHGKRSPWVSIRGCCSQRASRMAHGAWRLALGAVLFADRCSVFGRRRLEDQAPYLSEA